MNINDKIKLLQQHNIKYFIGRDCQTHFLKLYLNLSSNVYYLIDITRLNKKQLLHYLGYDVELSNNEYLQLCNLVYDRLI